MKSRRRRTAGIFEKVRSRSSPSDGELGATLHRAVRDRVGIRRATKHTRSARFHLARGRGFQRNLRRHRGMRLGVVPRSRHEARSRWRSRAFRAVGRSRCARRQPHENRSPLDGPIVAQRKSRLTNSSQVRRLWRHTRRTISQPTLPQWPLGEIATTIGVWSAGKIAGSRRQLTSVFGEVAGPDTKGTFSHRNQTNGEAPEVGFELNLRYRSHIGGGHQLASNCRDDLELPG